jgi:hypothetical protein
VELCLNARRADQAHPAFAKLFLETEFEPRYGALLARRRPRSTDEHPVWAIHTSAGSISGAEIEYETDRRRFLGRGRTPANPAALDSGSRLSETTGAVLDPIFSLRRRINAAAGSSTRFAFVTGAAHTREVAIGIAQRFREFEAIDRAFAGAKAHGETDVRELGLQPDEIGLFNRLAAAVIYTNASLRDLDAVAANRLGQPALWPHSISGDLPIVLVRVAGVNDEAVVRQLVRWRVYARRRGLKSDLVILDERGGEPADQLRKELETGISSKVFGKLGGVFFLTADKMTNDDAVLLAAAARAVLGGDRGSLTEQIDRSALQNTVNQALFLPTSRDVKYKAKAAIDTFIVRAGDLGSASLVAFGVHAGLKLRGFAWANVAMGFVWFAVAWCVGKRYRNISKKVAGPNTESGPFRQAA